MKYIIFNNFVNNNSVIYVILSRMHSEGHV